MPEQYLITKVMTCETCKGQKKIQSPRWAAFWEWFHQTRKDTGADPAPADQDAWWNDQGIYVCPPEEYACKDCNGRGWITSQADLADALRDLLPEIQSDDDDDNPYLLTGEELERALVARIAGRP